MAKKGQQYPGLHLEEYFQQVRGDQQQEILSEHKKTLFYCEGGQILIQLTQRGSGVSVCGDIQKLNRHSPRQLILLERGIVLDDLKRSLPTQTILCGFT